MVMSDNAKEVWIALIIAIGIVSCLSIIAWAETIEKLSDNPIIFRIETDDNMVKISQNMANATNVVCKDSQVKCECSGMNWDTPYYITNYTYNWSYSNNLSPYWGDRGIYNSPNIVWVSKYDKVVQ
jgi:hypothetical protein